MILGELGGVGGNSPTFMAIIVEVEVKWSDRRVQGKVEVE